MDGLECTGYDADEDSLFLNTAAPDLQFMYIIIPGTWMTHLSPKIKGKISSFQGLHGHFLQ